MTDDDRPEGAAPVPDWTELARRVAQGEVTALPDARATEGERMLGALAAALRPTLPAPPTAEETERALHAVLRRRDTASVPRRVGSVAPPSRRLARWTPAAVGVAAAAALVLYTQRDAPQHHGTPLPAASASAGRTTVGQVASLRLPDGTRVVLGPASVLDTAALFTAGRREVTLRGEALFDVVHDARRPFLVRTAQGIVRDVGTSFVVATDAATGTVVSVRSGVVSLHGLSRVSPDEVQLGAGDRARLTDTGATHVEHGVVTAADVAWTQGHLVLQDASVPDVEVAMRRWYGIAFRVADAALARRRVTASFGSESGADAARIVAAALGGAARVTGDSVTVTRLPADTTVR